MKIAVIYKWAPDPQNASVSESGEIDWGTKRTVSEYDPVAIRVGRILADETEAELIGITVGEKTASSPKAVQSAASRGLDRLIVVSDDELVSATPERYASVLAAILRNLDVDLILAGDASADNGGKAVPGLLAGLLGIPSFGEVDSVSRPNAEYDFIITRKLNGKQQKLGIKGRAIIAVTTDAAPIPLIGMKDMMAARKKPVEVLELNELNFQGLPQTHGIATLENVHKPVLKPRKQIVFDSDSAVAELIAALKEEGVL
ncbi:MAG: electron transfer flavoprotein beta subunit/FixA family protein [Arcanobacterium sp.]|nr:electron transfer flavoprotein beta subunit/FixA family protein [Arcanobacterium sp.]